MQVDKKTLCLFIVVVVFAYLLFRVSGDLTGVRAGIDQVRSDLGQLTSDYRGYADRVGALERGLDTNISKLGGIKDGIGEVSTGIGAAANRVGESAGRIADLQERSNVFERGLDEIERQIREGKSELGKFRERVKSEGQPDKAGKN